MTEKIFVDNLLAGRVALVTGGGTGITNGVARSLAAAGARLALVSRKMEHLEPAAEVIRRAGGDALPFAADVRSPEDVGRAVAACVARYGKLDIVVNGAAGNFLCPAEELSPNGFGAVVDIDLKGTFNVCRAAFDELKKGGGSILNISATLQLLGTPLQLHASAAKAGVDALTRNLAVEWGRYGIRTNAIAPGPIEDTEGIKRLLPGPFKEKLRQRIPVGRFGRVADVANCAVFLCSDAAAFVNGAIIVIDGGHWLNANRLLGPES
ncbi:MAG TPA: SDR family oxidoreductase [Pyrinomonadaceae bacterium]|jgi:peroxisomal 2,4-dienoyl-CoA reductase